MAEKFSFTNPNVPLFGPEYQNIKDKADRSMEEVRRAVAELEDNKKAKDDSSISETLRQLEEELQDALAEGDKKVEQHLREEIARIKREAHDSVVDRMAKDARPSAFAYGYGIALAMDAPRVPPDVTARFVALRKKKHELDQILIRAGAGPNPLTSTQRAEYDKVYSEIDRLGSQYRSLWNTD